MLTAPPATLPSSNVRAWIGWVTAAAFVVYNYSQQVVAPARSAASLRGSSTPMPSCRSPLASLWIALGLAGR
ncbi:MAG: hypothetical protein NTY53_20140 [Kiritimatiellaeota bacterium]|nr:hypothetical protein [Kiritimatiellota bacterium]